MRISVGQIYIKPGVSFPFSHIMQRWLGEELTAAADDWTEFAKKYGPGFSLVVRLSADTSIVSNVIKGPTVFRRDKDVEYTVFLPFEVIMTASNGCGSAMRHLIDGVRVVFRLAGIESSSLDAKESSMIEHACSEPVMLEEPWPQR